MPLDRTSKSRELLEKRITILSGNIFQSRESASCNLGQSLDETKQLAA